eukprot:c54872_g1_i1 orf=242-433(+)
MEETKRPHCPPFSANLNSHIKRGEMVGYLNKVLGFVILLIHGLYWICRTTTSATISLGIYFRW